MIVSVPGFKVVCDEPDCFAETGDRDDFSFYADADDAVECWTYADGQEVDGKHFCHEHVKPQETDV